MFEFQNKSFFIFSVFQSGESRLVPSVKPDGSVPLLLGADRRHRFGVVHRRAVVWWEQLESNI